MQTVTLNNGVEMPLVGFGVFQVEPGPACEEAVAQALSCGYRMIDTAVSYKNEESVGRAIAASGLPRENVFIATKAYIHQMGYERTRAAFEESCAKLGTDYLDF